MARSSQVNSRQLKILSFKPHWERPQVFLSFSYGNGTLVLKECNGRLPVVKDVPFSVREDKHVYIWDNSFVYVTSDEIKNMEHELVSRRLFDVCDSCIPICSCYCREDDVAFIPTKICSIYRPCFCKETYIDIIAYRGPGSVMVWRFFRLGVNFYLKDVGYKEFCTSIALAEHLWFRYKLYRDQNGESAGVVRVEDDIASFAPDLARLCAPVKMTRMTWDTMSKLMC